MRVIRIETAIHPRSGAPRPTRDALQALPGAGGVEVLVHTDEGVTGRGECSFGRIGGAPQTLATFVDQILAPVVVGSDPAHVRGTHRAMLRETEYLGYVGLAAMAISAVDTALWDCLGKAYGVPCWKMWGAVHERVPAYAMVGWLNYSENEVQAICAQAVEQGFRAVKVKVGFPTLEEDVRRIEVVRQAVGREVRLMVDANQSLTTAEALRRGRAFQELGLYWWEEPLPSDDIDGYAELAAALDIPIATGENLYSIQEFGRFFRRGAVDIVQPDLRRSGGPTALLEVAALADAYNVPYASHGSNAAHLNVMACAPTLIYAEMGLVRPGSPARIEDGCVGLPQGAGLSWE
jgi:L-alanine-DL-glutamate epimerase-like enolase superfamily enzyme